MRSRIVRTLRPQGGAAVEPSDPAAASDAPRSPAPPGAPAVQVIGLDYPVHSVPRYGFGKPPHPELYGLIAKGNERYAETLTSFVRFREHLLRIPVSGPERSAEPRWVNGMIPALDTVSLYSFLALRDPLRYVEVGSGNSTAFARRAIQDQRLRTSITSIDPHPRAEIDAVCDRVIRQPLEELDLALFRELEAGDVLFVDGSHRVFMNSDAVVVFLEIIPRLPPGVLVQIHDIRLPYDYYPEWADRYYSEQYLLAAYLLAGGDRVSVALPNAFISAEPRLHALLDRLWRAPQMSGAETHGDSFWLETR